MDKKVIWLDLDGVIVDFWANVLDHYERIPLLRERYKNNPDHIHGIFRNPPPIAGAIEAVKLLRDSGKYELYIATACPWANPQGAADKRYWVEQYFGDMFYKRVTITHNKDMLRGDYLIDDRTANGAGNFSGKLMLFGSAEYPDWDSVLRELL
jgi:5'-nucleotidase